MADEDDDDLSPEEARELAALQASYLAADADVRRLFLNDLLDDPEHADTAKDILRRFPKPH